MTVAELMEILSTFDKDTEVVTGQLKKLEVVNVIDKVVLRESERILVRPRDEELTSA